ncbi:MAG UNVERIFIED_CONTAM: flagellar basal body rod protein FlgC [Rickettsiaceae bacterium]
MNGLLRRPPTLKLECASRNDAQLPVIASEAMRSTIIVLLTSLILTPLTTFALEDSLQKSIEIAVAGNNVQSERLKLVAENMANEHTTSETPDGNPYKRKIMFVENKYDKSKKANIVRVKKYSEDKSPFEIKYDPSHPSADANGYVKLPNVRRQVEMADASEAQRSYEANLGVVEISRSMIQKTLDVIR